MYSVQQAKPPPVHEGGVLCQCLPAEAWARLAEPVRRVREAGVEHRGCFHVGHGRGWLARFLARTFRLPPPKHGAVARLRIVADGARELWHRSFDGYPLQTTQWCAAGVIGERWGFISVFFRPQVRDGGLRYEQIGAAICLGRLQFPIPRWLAPRVEASEEAIGEQRTHIQVMVSLPCIGRLIAYKGEVEAGR